MTQQEKFLLEFLEDLCSFGLAIVKNVPQDLEGLPKLIKAIFEPEITHYGPYWKVEQKFDANNLAYTGATLGKIILCTSLVQF